MEARRKDLKFLLCFRCLNQLELFYERQKKKKKELKKMENLLKKQGTVTFSSHTSEKLRKSKLSEKEVIKALFSGKPIEYQSTPYKTECKIIFKGGNFSENPLHIIVLFNELQKVPKVVTVYNPTIGAWWKWNADYTRRIYINEFRACCVHPFDSKKAYNKKHHDKPYHPIYTWKYRLKNKDKDHPLN